jgi:membrane protease YdiL (CAAX protease family)
MSGHSGPADERHHQLESDGHAVQPVPTAPGPQVPLAESVEEPVAAVQLIACWRCHKWVPDSAFSCHYCEARLKADDSAFERITAANPDNPYCSATIVIDKGAEARRTESARRGGAVTSLIWFFFAILGVGVVQGLVAHAMLAAPTPGTDEGRVQLILVLIVEAADVLLVLLALAKIPRPEPLPRTDHQRVAGWLAGIPILAVVLGLNVAYHWLLRRYLRLPDHLLEPEFGKTSLLLVFGITCIQPAIIEELFFRYLALGTLRNVTGVTGAIWLSSIMFGMAHIGVPFSIPILIVVGLGLGCARVLSGSVLLPMFLHFAHNAVVMLLNGSL